MGGQIGYRWQTGSWVWGVEALADWANLSRSRVSFLDPDFTLRRFRTFLPSDNPTFLAGRERINEGMRMAGMPEG